MKKGKVLLFIYLFVLFGCKSEYDLLLKGNENNQKYVKAKEYFNEKEYDKAAELLENIRPFYSGHEKSSDINYILAEIYYIKRDLLTASYYFEYYHRNFSDSLTQKAMYMDAYCNYRMSPKYTLDQTATKLAIDKFQKYINKYPDSEDYKKINEYISDLRKKLEKKSLDISLLYYRHDEYKACDVSLDTFLEEYPDSENIEEVYYYKVLSSFMYAKNSIESKKDERLKYYRKNYEKMLKLYPNTKYKQELENLK